MKAKFVQLGTGQLAKTKVGKPAIKFNLNPDLIEKMPRHDYENLWLFKNSKGYSVMGVIKPDKPSLKKWIDNKKAEQQERFDNSKLKETRLRASVWSEVLLTLESELL